MSRTGRPSSYKPEFVGQAKRLCQIGATDADLAVFFEVEVRTIQRWKHEHPEFCHSLKAGKTDADDRVERSLYHRAVGYVQPAVKIFMPAGADAPVYAPFEEQVAPDTTAAIFWLKNRRPEQWRDKTIQEHSGPNGGPIETAEVSGRELVDSRIARLATRATTEGNTGKPH